MLITDTADEFINFLLEHYGTYRAALAHAEWARDFVIKSETKAFWKEVIEELKKLNGNSQKEVHHG